MATRNFLPSLRCLPFQVASQTDWRLRAPVLRALSIAHLVRGHLDLAEQHGEELLELAGQTADRVVDTEAHYVIGVTAFWRGNFVLARKHLEYALVSCEPEPSPLHLALYAQDPEGEDRVRAAYPGSAFERLARLKSQYGPDNFFRLNQNIRPSAAGHARAK